MMLPLEQQIKHCDLSSIWIYPWQERPTIWHLTQTKSQQPNTSKPLELDDLRESTFLAAATKDRDTNTFRHLNLIHIDELTFRNSSQLSQWISTRMSDLTSFSWPIISKSLNAYIFSYIYIYIHSSLIHIQRLVHDNHQLGLDYIVYLHETIATKVFISCNRKLVDR